MIKILGQIAIGWIAMSYGIWVFLAVLAFMCIAGEIAAE